MNAEDANGVISAGYFSDSLDRPPQVRRAVGTAPASQTTFAYDDTSRIITTSSDKGTHNDILIVGKLVYDQLGRTIETNLDGLLGNCKATDSERPR